MITESQEIRSTLGFSALAEYFVAPSNAAELATLLECWEGEVRVIGRGSNVFLESKVIPGLVVSLERMTGWEIIGKIKTGAQVWMEAGCYLPKMIRHLGKLGLGGCEYLVNVPASLGGAVCNNAGKGPGTPRLWLGWRVEWVRVLRDGVVVDIAAKDCGFGWRESAFQGRRDIILGALIGMDSVRPAEVLKRINARLKECKSSHDYSGGNAGCVFKTGFNDAIIPRGLKCGGVSVSMKNKNWILAERGCQRKDLRELLNKIMGENKKLKIEWQIWN